MARHVAVQTLAEMPKKFRVEHGTAAVGKVLGEARVHCEELISKGCVFVPSKWGQIFALGSHTQKS